MYNLQTLANKCWRKPNGQSRMDNLETLANKHWRKPNGQSRKCTIQRHWQYWAHMKQEKDKQNTKTQHNSMT